MSWFDVSWLVLVVVVGTLVVAGGAHLLSEVTVARAFTGVALALALVGGVGLTLLTSLDDDDLSVRILVIRLALFNFPTLLCLLAFVAALRPSGGMAFLQLIALVFLTMISGLFAFSVGIVYLFATILVFLGMLFTLGAAIDRNRRNEAYWRHFFSTR